MPTPTLDAIDKRILDNLQRAGRLTNLELADRIGLSPSPCLRRVRMLETEDVIEGYGARLNRENVGLGLMAFIGVNVEGHGDAGATFRAAVTQMPEVVACYIVSGDDDFLLQVVVPSLADYRAFTLDRLLKVPGIKNIRSSFVIDTVKENAPLPLAHLR